MRGRAESWHNIKLAKLVLVGRDSPCDRWDKKMCYIIENSLERCHRLGCVITEMVMNAETKREQLERKLEAANNLAAEDEVAKREQLQRELAALKSSIENVEEVWREQVQGYAGDWTEDTLLQVVAEEFEFQATEDVEITVTISQTVTVRKPIGTNLNSHDFWMQKDCELLECNYEITEEESASVEDVSE